MYLPVPEATLEAPPQEGEEGYAEYVAAYKAFLIASDPSMVVPRLHDVQMDSKWLARAHRDPRHGGSCRFCLPAALDQPRSAKTFKPLTKQPEYLTGGTLMDFQIEGVNFLRR